MSFIPILALAAAVFLFAAFALKLPRAGWTLFGAALLFGLTGYALQGSPGYAGAPKNAAPSASEDNFAMIDARRDFFDPASVPSRFVTVADGFSRNGQFQDAANMLRNAVSENPGDTEAWVALGNAIIEHADGTLTPAALYAYSRADRISPEHPAASYFLGVGLLRSGRPGEARGVWADMVEKAPEDAVWKPQLQDRLERLDQLLAQIGPQGPVTVPAQ